MKKALILASVASMIEQFNMDNIKLLQNQGYQVDVMANFEDGGTIDNKRLEEFKKELDKINVQYFHNPFNRNPLSTKNIEAYKILKRIINKNQYNLVHMHSPIGGLCGRLACKKLRKTGTKVIYTAHGFHFYKGAPIINWLIYYPLEKYLARYTDVLITINKEDYDIAKKKLKTKQICHVNGVGMKTEKFSKILTEEEKAEFKKHIGIEKKDIVLSYIAELNNNKNQILLINYVKKIIEKNKNIKLLLIGNGPLFNEYTELIKKEKLENYIKLLGYRKDINELLQITDIVTASSIREGLPVNIMEAMYLEKPIIATKNRGHSELIINNENGYLIPLNNIDTFIEKLLYLVNNENKRREMGKKNKDLVKPYTTENVMQQMDKIYKAIGGNIEN